VWTAGGECGVPFWKRMLMPVSEHPWVDAQAQRRAPEWYSYNYGPVRRICCACDECPLLI
jgi:hypothetical protein